ncbi:hypothetical protein PSECIP111951_03626 [Pseudoalteromonas holothuriae]|uniref:Peptidase C-terminal archaeal/bacterial domain-containing protein n=1 Tax=Pseudoalteromonas holothuriae TaxID=2963714 RepID=A0ABM9GMD5_9GAMM|nr:MULTISPECIES: PPC domain-containing protein [unclassified Pseudoalteromonas]CAH9066693.1 hypothetical protein PSECIP111951_03626 [Pseudoalteromonas sp. CIP111951]
MSTICSIVNATDEFKLVQFTLAGGQGNADIYVQQDSLPNLQTYDCISSNQGNDEICSLAARTAPFYIRVYANSGLVTRLYR